MALFWIEAVNSLYDWFEANPEFDYPVLLGWGGETLRETHLRVAWGDGELEEGTGEYDSEQTIYVEGWVFDENGNQRRAAYGELSLLLRKMVKGVFEWRDLQNGLDIDISIQNHADFYAPHYGFQLTVNQTQNHLCRVVDNL